MNFNNLLLYVDLKTCDRLREWFSKRGSLDNIQIQAIEVGDSDIDYNLSHKASTIRTLNAPYQVSRIKHKLIYTGSVNGGIAGVLTTFLRRVNTIGQIESLYAYPPDFSTYSLGVVPPTLVMGADWSVIQFDTLSIVKEGFIVYMQTLPDGYIDPNTNLPMRWQEEYDLTFSVDPATLGWEVIPDVVNGSFMIAKPDAYVFLTLTGTITVKGRDTGIERVLTFNY